MKLLPVVIAERSGSPHGLGINCNVIFVFRCLLESLPELTGARRNASPVAAVCLWPASNMPVEKKKKEESSQMTFKRTGEEELDSQQPSGCRSTLPVKTSH